MAKSYTSLRYVLCGSIPSAYMELLKLTSPFFQIRCVVGNYICNIYNVVYNVVYNVLQILVICNYKNPVRQCRALVSQVDR